MRAGHILLVTAFEAFGADSVNASAEVLRLLPDLIGPWRIVKCILPVVFGEGARNAIRAAEDAGAEAVLCLGQAGGRDQITPEMIGLNLRDAGIPDNAGIQPHDEPVDPDGPDALFTTLSARDMTPVIRTAGLPAARSYSAGTFVCNDVLYSLLLHFRGTQVRVGFLHVPALPGQHAVCLAVEQSASAVEAAIRSVQP